MAWIAVLVVLVLVLPRFLGWVGALRISAGDLCAELEIATEPSPAWWRAAIQPARDALIAEGFEEVADLTIRYENLGTTPATLLARPADRLFAFLGPMGGAAVDRHPVGVAIASEHGDTWFQTGNHTGLPHPPYDCVMASDPSPGGILRAHLARIPPLEQRSASNAAEIVERANLRSAQAKQGMLASGALVDAGGGAIRLSLREAWRALERNILMQRVLAKGPLASVQPEHDLLMREMNRQLPSLPRRRARVLAAVSLLAFLLSMLWLFDAVTALMATVVIIVHEAGHALAMRAVGIRDARVYFVPFLGAATIGRPGTPSAWRDLVVLLAGPVPGLVVGLALLASGSESEHVARLGAIFAGINAVNLLPLEPLDGGKIVHRFLFRRAGRLEAFARAASGVALFTIALMVPEPALAVIGVLVLMGVPRAFEGFKIARTLQGPAQPIDVARALRSLSPVPPVGRRIALVDEVLAIQESKRTPLWIAGLAFALLAGSFAVVIFAVTMVMDRGPHGLEEAPLATFEPPAGDEWDLPPVFESALADDPESMLGLRCRLPGGALEGSAVEPLAAFLSLPPDLGALPPWSAELTAEHAAHRQSWSRLSGWSVEAQQHVFRAGMAGIEADDIDELRARGQQLAAQSNAVVEARIRNEGHDIHPDVVKAWNELSSAASTAAMTSTGSSGRAEWISNRADRIARLAPLFGASTPTAPRLAGMVTKDEGELVLPALYAPDIASLRALVGWLRRVGCASPRFELIPRYD